MWGQNTRKRADFWGRTWDSRYLKYLYAASAISITSLNIRLGRAGRLEAALRALKQGNINVGILKETKITKGIHMCYGAGYAVLKTEAESKHQEGVVVVWREEVG